jgi:hypothetical protein
MGLRRPPSETPREFARRAADVLSARAAGDGDVAGLPAAVVDAFYRVRYGGRELSAREVGTLEARLDVLEASLRPS